MNKVIIKFKDGNRREVKTNLSDDEKIISFLKLTGEWSSSIVGIELVENIVSASCNYQNMDQE